MVRFYSIVGRETRLTGERTRRLGLRMTALSSFEDAKRTISHFAIPRLPVIEAMIVTDLKSWEHQLLGQCTWGTARGRLALWSAFRLLT